MGKYEIVLNSNGVRELLQSQWIQAICEEQAQLMLNQLGADYEMESFLGFDRVHVLVKTGNDRAAQQNLDDNTILKAVQND